MPEKDRNIYDLALMVQDASNLQGITKTLHEQIVPAAKEDGRHELMKHPAVMMFVHQIQFLALNPDPEKPEMNKSANTLLENLIGILQEDIIPDAREDRDYDVSENPLVRRIVAKISYLASPQDHEEWDFLHSICQSESNFSHVDEPPSYVRT